MNKKISIPIIPLIVILITVVIVVAIILTRGTSEKKSKLSKIYEKMISTQTYTFTRYDFEEQHKLITYREGNKTLIDMYNPGDHSSTLVLEGDTYQISHKDKEYYVYPNNNLDEDILTDNLKDIVDLEYTTGKEKIYGKTYNYEEYKGVSYFLISSRNMEKDTVRTRFYFKGNELVYLKTIYDTIDGETGEELQTVSVEFKVDDSIFKVPEDYAEN